MKCICHIDLTAVVRINQNALLRHHYDVIIDMLVDLTAPCVRIRRVDDPVVFIHLDMEAQKANPDDKKHSTDCKSNYVMIT
jgi:hypothetical protein